MNERILEAKIMQAVTKAVQQSQILVSERYVTAEELSKYIGTLTPRFLQDHGSMFPRQQFKWIDKNGVEHRQGWLYPLHEIMKMFVEGEFIESNSNL